MLQSPVADDNSRLFTKSKTDYTNNTIDLFMQLPYGNTHCTAKAVFPKTGGKKNPGSIMEPGVCVVSSF